jgi:hypothetical protein
MVGLPDWEVPGLEVFVVVLWSICFKNRLK